MTTLIASKCRDCSNGVTGKRSLCDTCLTSMLETYTPSRRICEICGAGYRTRDRRIRTCGRVCGRVLMQASRPGDYRRAYFGLCSICHKPYSNRNMKLGKYSICKESECKREHNRLRGLINYQLHADRFKTTAQNRRTRQAGVFVESISTKKIGVRDGWHCYLCDLPIDPSLKNRNPLMPSLDHVIPISKGGLHSKSNVRITHYRCNLEKNAKILGANDVRASTRTN